MIPAILCLILCSCTAQSEANANAANTEAPADPDKLVFDLTGEPPAGFIASDGWTNGNMFNVTWRKDNVIFGDGRMRLCIDRDSSPENGIPYSGAEYRSDEHYGYGRYEVTMKPIKNDGVVSSFFTYTGPSEKNAWDEIDIEFLGKDTSIVQFNYFTDGKGEHEYVYDLGFDAAEDFHDYAFEWHPDHISWYVDGKEVHTVTEEIPTTPGRIMVNAWCGTGVDGWLNAFDDSGLPVYAEYKSIAFTAEDEQ
ncbi:MAG: glycoside hydrolase family 16 protein [Oscillospiraceae bacterium]|nr:glycoside hydrolase family 16 protein [Oscillospiraceae bacterium]